MITSHKRKQARIEEDDAEFSWNDNHFLTFTAYFIAWLQNGGEKYEDTLKKIKVHELLIALSDGNLLDEGSSSRNVRRFFFVEENECISFGFVCDEFGSQSISYLSFIDCTGYGTSMTKPIVRAYSEYISLIAPEWTLHIWADPPTPENPNYLFYKAPAKPNLKSADKLRDMYVGLLSQSGFTNIAPYEWKPTLPPIPSFGKKSDDAVVIKHKAMVDNFNDVVEEFNGLFRNTCCVKLRRNKCFKDKNFKVHCRRFRTTRGNDKNLWTAENIASDATYDYSTLELAKESTKNLIARMREVHTGYFTMTLDSLTKYRTMYDNYMSILRTFKGSISDVTTSNETTK